MHKNFKNLLFIRVSAIYVRKSGADFIIMPCNTAHYFISEIQQSIKIPILNMIKETAHHVKSIFPSVKNVGLLATKGTYKTGLYNSFFKEKNIEILIPSPLEQDKIMDIIYKIKKNILTKEMKIQIIKIAEKQIKRGAQAIIAGCTEIPLILKNEDLKVPVIDPTNILAKKAIEVVKNKIY